MTIAQRINARFEKRDANEKGLALLDVLLGMAIFALIVVIGVQNFSTLRNRAYTTQVSSDVKQSATALQAKMTEPNATLITALGGTTALPAANADITTVIEGLGANLTGDNVVEFDSGNAAGDFVICVERGSAGPSAIYSSATSVVTTGAGACA